MIACTPPRFSVRAKCSAKSNAARISATPKMPTSAAVPVKAAAVSIEARTLLPEQIAVRRGDGILQAEFRHEMRPVTDRVNRAFEYDALLPGLRPQ